MKTKKVLAIILTVLLVMTMAVGCSQSSAPAKAKYPEKTIDMTILFGAGAAADIVGRKLAEIAAKDLGQTIVANNRVGGGGAVGYQYVLGTPADGYNIVWNSTSINVAYHQGNMPKDKAWDSFRGVAKITQEASVLAVKADSKWKTFEEFIAYAKANPGKVTVANSGVGSFNQLIAGAIESAAGVQFKHVPMDAKQSTIALLGGKVDAVVNMAFDMIQQEQAGQTKTLVVVADKRLDMLKDVPTMKEKGYDLTLTMYRGIAVPKGTPDDVVKTLESAFMKAGNSEEFKTFAAKYGVQVDVKNGADFDKEIGANDTQVASIMEKIGLKKQ
ncbi:MAG: tripartite tricarboxylate transporter substrate binding protein [Peptococcaceae bacterium]|nr:tripartite tricarboxylate transporter substrate binding protein [Peptococcaceae bacterium]